MKRISICTVSMNRLFHIRETLPANIKDNAKYENIEFILLDYNSSDGLDNWIKCQMMEYIDSGLLKYYKISTPVHFDRCHSRNLACKLASGDIIALVDADNYTGVDYAQWLANVFLDEGDNSVVTAIDGENMMFRDQGGKCAFHATYFMQSRGFDETMNGYGFEDVDFMRRLVQVGGKRIPIQNIEFFKFIGHSDVERICNEQLLNSTNTMYTLITEDTEDRKEVNILYLLDNDRFMNVAYEFRNELKTNIYSSYWGWLIKQDGRRLGSYRSSAGLLELRYDEAELREIFLMDEEGNILMNGDDPKWTLAPSDVNTYSKYSLLYTECWNRNVYYSNIAGTVEVNPHGFGKGEVVLNFTVSISIN